MTVFGILELIFDDNFVELFGGAVDYLSGALVLADPRGCDLFFLLGESLIILTCLLEDDPNSNFSGDIYIFGCGDSTLAKNDGCPFVEGYRPLLSVAIYRSGASDSIVRNVAFMAVPLAFTCFCCW